MCVVHKIMKIGFMNQYLKSDNILKLRWHKYDSHNVEHSDNYIHEIYLKEEVKFYIGYAICDKISNIKIFIRMRTWTTNKTNPSKILQAIYWLQSDLEMDRVKYIKR